MVKGLLPDDLWAEIAPLMPARKARPAVEARDRDALVGILFVLYTAIPWERLPFEVAGCSGMTCWRRLRAWQDAGLWDEIHRHMLDRLNRAGQIDWSRASVSTNTAIASSAASIASNTFVASQHATIAAQSISQASST
jgi:transposase